MDATSTSPLQASTTNSSVSSNSFSNGLNNDFDTFLRLLTTQIRNQDPLSPQDSTEFVAQLATFSSVEQQIQSNDHLNFMASLMDEFFGLVASQWIGEPVEIQSAFVPFDGNPVDFTADIPDDVNQLVLSVEDRDGNLVYSGTLDRDADKWSWDGTNFEGETLGNDVYKFSLELYSNGEFAGSLAPNLITEVTDASLENGRLRLGFANHLSEFADSVRKVK